MIDDWNDRWLKDSVDVGVETLITTGCRLDQRSDAAILLLRVSNPAIPDKIFRQSRNPDRCFSPIPIPDRS